MRGRALLLALDCPRLLLAPPPHLHLSLHVRGLSEVRRHQQGRQVESGLPHLSHHHLGVLAGGHQAAAGQVQGPRLCDGPRRVRPHRPALPLRQEALRVHGVREGGHQAGADVEHHAQ